MWGFVLKWLPVFSLIFVGTTLSLGILLGIARSLKHIYGRWDDGLFGFEKAGKYLLEIEGLIPLVLLEGGVFSIVGGLIGIVLVHYGNVRESEVITGISLGGLIGVCNVGFVSGLYRLFGDRALSIAGGIVVVLGSFAGGLADGFPGAIAGGLASLMVVVVFARKFVDDDITGLVPGSGWIAAGVAGWIAGNFYTTGWLTGIGIGVSFGVFTSLMASLLAVFVLVFAYLLIEKGVCFFLIPFLISLRFKPMICVHCLRYTYPLKSTYKTGIRYCEHCHHHVEITDDPGKVIVMLGQFPLTAGNRTFVLSDTEFETNSRTVDVTEVYFDTTTCAPLLVERFMTHIFNHPPTQGIETVKVFYKGELDNLGKNVRNALQNSFKCVERIY